MIMKCIKCGYEEYTTRIDCPKCVNGMSTSAMEEVKIKEEQGRCGSCWFCDIESAEDCCKEDKMEKQKYLTKVINVEKI